MNRFWQGPASFFVVAIAAVFLILGGLDLWRIEHSLWQRALAFFGITVGATVVGVFALMAVDGKKALTHLAITRAELDQVDEALARRPALENYPTRYAKICHACDVAGRIEQSDNPRMFCPECDADLGRFYSNRIRMVR